MANARKVEEEDDQAFAWGTRYGRWKMGTPEGHALRQVEDEGDQAERLDQASTAPEHDLSEFDHLKLFPLEASGYANTLDNLLEAFRLSNSVSRPCLCLFFFLLPPPFLFTLFFLIFLLFSSPSFCAMFDFRVGFE